MSDPRAVPSVLAVFARGKTNDRDRAARLLGQIDAPGSSRALAAFAVSDESAEIRRAATETRKHRDPREFAGWLVALLREPIKYEVRPVGGPGSPGALFVSGRRFNVRRVYVPPAVPYVAYDLNARFWLDNAGLPVMESTLDWYKHDPGRLVPRVGEAEADAMVHSELQGFMFPASGVQALPGLTTAS